MYGYNAEPPIAFPIYTVLPYCVMYNLKQTAYTARVDVHFSTYTHTCIYMNYLRRSIFLLLVALLDTYLITNMISRLGIVIKSV